MKQGNALRQRWPAQDLLAGILIMLLLCLCAPEKSQGTYLIFTTDVCWTCGDDFLGAWHGKNYGVPFITEKLEQYGLKGTFFVSSLCPPGLTNKMFDNLSFLVSRGHDLELHPHPDGVDPSRPLPNMYSIEERKRFLDLAIRNIERAGAPRPVAHRAAAWAIDRATLNLLPELGIHMDSSVFPLDSRSLVTLPEGSINRFAKIDGLYQLPITLVRRVPFIGYAGMTSLDIDRTIWEEQEEALNQIAAHGLAVATFSMHFYNFFQYTRPAVPYQPLQITGIREENIQKLDKVLKLVTSDRRFKVVTAREVWQIFQQRPQDLQGPSFVPYTGIWLTYVKAWKDFFGYGIKNKIVVLLPIILLLIIIAGVALGLRMRRVTKGSR
jgi:peptidoglycan/xylan/chitin deacetylase (PgdA/CDA1 family)